MVPLDQPARSQRADNSSTSDRIRVVLADDHAIVRAGLAALISTQDDMEVVGEAEDGEQVVEAHGRLQPDLVLMDLQMPKMDGVEAITRIRAAVPDAAILVLTTFSGDAQAVRALKAGACGYLLKTDLRKALFTAMRTAVAGGRHLNGKVVQEVARHSNDQLTNRECDIVRLAGEGKSNRQIASILLLSEETVKGYMKMIFLKLGAADRAHAVTISVRRGFIGI